MPPSGDSSESTAAAAAAAATTTASAPPPLGYQSPSFFRRFPYPYLPLSTLTYLTTIIICIYNLSVFGPIWKKTNWDFLIASWVIGILASTLSLIQALILWRLHATRRLRRSDVVGLISFLVAGLWLAVLIVSWTWYERADDIHTYNPDGSQVGYSFNLYPFTSTHTRSDGGHGQGLVRRGTSKMAGTGMFALAAVWNKRFGTSGAPAGVGVAFAGAILVTASFVWAILDFFAAWLYIDYKAQEPVPAKTAV